MTCILKFLDCKVSNPSLFLQQVKSRENKTKSIGLNLPFDRPELWNKKCELLYQKIGFGDLEKALIKLK